jgi:phthalate 4,5-dioxygenase reductase subunit
MNTFPASLRITHRQALCEGVVLFRLSALDGERLPALKAGAHLSVKTPSGKNRSYSLCSSPSENHFYELAIKKEEKGRGGSSSMVDGLKEGDLLEVIEGANYFELKQGQPRYIFVAGGIGITPILSMMHLLLHEGVENFVLHYCTREKESTPFFDLLSQEPFASHVHFHHDAGDPKRSFDFWPVFEKTSNAHIYCCGPQGLMDTVRDMTGHWPSEQVHFESFGVTPVDSSLNAEFSVKLQSSGKVIPVSAQQSILQALKQAGQQVPSSCESGTCGSCRVGLLEGEADHRDFVLMDDEFDKAIMICVSRAKSEQLVLDL